MIKGNKKFNVISAAIFLLLIVLFAGSRSIAVEAEEIISITDDTVCEESAVDSTYDSNDNNDNNNDESIPQLTAPKNLQWGKWYDSSTGECEDVPGCIYWEMDEDSVCQNEFYIRWYSADDGSVVLNSNTGFSPDKKYYSFSTPLFIENEHVEKLGDGEYYFTIQALGDGVNYRDSEIVRSDTWEYISGSDKLEYNANPVWVDSGYGWPYAEVDLPVDTSNVLEIQYSLWFSKDADSEPDQTGTGSKYYISSNTDRIKPAYSTMLNDYSISKYGPGYYYFKVRAVSKDVTKYKNSDWSGFGTPYYVKGSGKSLDEILEDESILSDPSEIRKAVQDIDSNDLRTGILSDENVRNQILQLEEKTGAHVGVSVDESLSDSFGSDEVKIIGAALNEPESNTNNFELQISPADNADNLVIPELYDDTLAVKFNMDVEGIANTKQLSVPVYITMPVPSNINPDYLVLIHYALDGKPEVLDHGTNSLLVVFERDGKYFVSFVLDHFSSFAMTQEKKIPDEDTGWGDILSEDRPEDGIIPEGLWIAGVNQSGYEYNGKACMPVVRVYDNKVMLKANRDYTLSYKNNVNAYLLADGDAGFDGAAAPAIAVTGKGNYDGTETAYFKINPIDITEDAVINDIYTVYNGKAQKPVPVVKLNGKTLKNGTDYTHIYKNSEGSAITECVDAGKYTIEITGRGNYTGSQTISFVISDTNLKPISKATISKIADKTYTGKPITLEAVDNFTVMDGKTPLTQGKDYEISYKNNVNAGTASVIITAKEGSGYYGQKTASLRITGISINKTVISGISDKTYTGGEITQNSLQLKYNDTPLSMGTDYTVSYSGNVKAGTAGITISGKGKYTGSVKKTFKITPCKITDSGIIISTISGARYAKGGCKPVPVIKYSNGSLNTTLINGADYTLSYKKNTSVGNATVTIKGKGNFTGSRTVNFTISKQNLGNLVISVPDKAYSAKKNNYKSSVKIFDLDGKALKAGTDYDKALTFVYADGKEIGADDIPAAGTEIKVIVKAGKNSNYTGELEGTYHIMKTDISKAKVTVKNPENGSINLFPYTGKAITLKQENLKVDMGSVTLTADDYEILTNTYKNNINKGKATVQIRGKGNYGGTATVTYNIGTKGFLWWWRQN